MSFCMHIYLCTLLISSDCGGQITASDILELELKIQLGHCALGPGNQIFFLCKNKGY